MAGKNILFLLSTRVFERGYMHGLITTYGHYCQNVKSLLVSASGDGHPENEHGARSLKVFRN